MERFIRISLICLFVSILTIPGIFVSNRERSLIANRKLNVYPKEYKNITEYIESIDKYINDQYGFKETILKYGGILHYLINSSTSPLVINGREDWMFFGAKFDGNPMSDITYKSKFSEEEKERWKRNIDLKIEYLDSLNIGYSFFIAPNKSTIYNEYLPSKLHKVNNQKRIDQFIEIFSDYSQSRIIDLRAELENRKSDQFPLYGKYGTHWNSYGTSVAHTTIANLMSIDLVVTNYDETDFVWKPQGADMDLAKLQVIHQVLDSRTPSLKEFANTIEKIYLDRGKYNLNNGRPLYLLSNEKAPDRNLVIFGDSFSEMIVPYFCQYFKKVVVVWTRPNKEIIDLFINDYSPKYILEERVERYLGIVPNSF